MLDGAAVGYRPYPPGHLVVFRYSGSTGKTARAVTMSGRLSTVFASSTRTSFCLQRCRFQTALEEVPANMVLQRSIGLPRFARAAARR